MQCYIDDIHIWMIANFLKCNGDKTEILLIGSHRQRASISLDGITIDNAIISPSAAACNLGIIFDSKMSLVPQVGAVCKSVRYYLHIIGRIRRFLTSQACELLMHALVTSRMDMYNGLLTGLPRCLTNRIQLCQNVTARIVNREKRPCHITPIWGPPLASSLEQSAVQDLVARLSSFTRHVSCLYQWVVALTHTRPLSPVCW